MCPVLPCSALPRPGLHCPALPSPALPFPATAFYFYSRSMEMTVGMAGGVAGRCGAERGGPGRGWGGRTMWEVRISPLQPGPHCNTGLLLATPLDQQFNSFSCERGGGGGVPCTPTVVGRQSRRGAHVGTSLVSPPAARATTCLSSLCLAAPSSA